MLKRCKISSKDKIPYRESTNKNKVQQYRFEQIFELSGLKASTFKFIQI